MKAWFKIYLQYVFVSLRVVELLLVILHLFFADSPWRTLRLTKMGWPVRTLYQIPLMLLSCWFQTPIPCGWCAIWKHVSPRNGSWSWINQFEAAGTKLCAVFLQAIHTQALVPVPDRPKPMFDSILQTQHRVFTSVD